MKLLILDTETTSADLNASVCEIAGTLYQIGETERQTGAIASMATLRSSKSDRLLSIPEIREPTQKSSAKISGNLVLFTTPA